MQKRNVKLYKDEREIERERDIESRISHNPNRIWYTAYITVIIYCVEMRIAGNT